MRIKNIKVKDFVNPEYNSQPFYTVLSYWNEETKDGVCFAEKLDPRSHFYPPERFAKYRTNDLDELKNYHNQLVSDLDWRTKKTEEKVKA